MLIPSQSLARRFSSSLRRSTPNGSWGIVQVQPTSRPPALLPQYPQRQLGDRSSSAYIKTRFNNPPTAVGGIREKNRLPVIC